MRVDMFLKCYAHMVSIKCDAYVLLGFIQVNAVKYYGISCAIHWPAHHTIFIPLCYVWLICLLPAPFCSLVSCAACLLSHCAVGSLTLCVAHLRPTVTLGPLILLATHLPAQCGVVPLVHV